MLSQQKIHKIIVLSFLAILNYILLQYIHADDFYNYVNIFLFT